MRPALRKNSSLANGSEEAIGQILERIVPFSGNRAELHLHLCGAWSRAGCRGILPIAIPQ